MEETKNKTNWMQLISFVVIALLTAEVVLLIQQNKKLKTALSPPPMESLKPGESVAPFKVQTLDGQTTEVAYSDSMKKYLLFVLSTTCPHCERNLEYWQSIVDQESSNGCDILGISINDLNRTSDYAIKKNIGFVIVSAAADTGFSRRYKIGGVPETILIDGHGVVEKTWAGELTAEQTNEIKILIGASKSIK